VADDSDNAINSFDRNDWDARWKEYKGSIKWYRLKDLALTRAGNQCEHIEEPTTSDHNRINRCKSRRHLEMHHLQYPDNPDEDCLDNVVILCQKHHREVGRYD
jgi:hypothetical protein